MEEKKKDKRKKVKKRRSGWWKAAKERIVKFFVANLQESEKERKGGKGEKRPKTRQNLGQVWKIVISP